MDLGMDTQLSVPRQGVPAEQWKKLRCLGYIGGYTTL